MPEDLRSDKIFSVTEVNTLAHKTLTQGVGSVWVRGEVTGLKTQSNGHIYFSLKDATSVLNVALFKSSATKLSVKIEEGKQILVFGEVGLYLPRGSYQMIGRFVLDEGAGRLQQEFERLKRQLETEGLFAKERKIEIPKMPKIVAFVTSPTGAVWQDFTRILARRDWRGRVILFPCAVQGPAAPGEIVRALKMADNWPGTKKKTFKEEARPVEAQGNLFANIEEINSMEITEKIDLIVVGRGGGSLEDLWAFNEERVVRAVAATETPIISAVGHETDFTLCDFAADFRAETPSAAAELIAGYFNEARDDVDNQRLRLMRAFQGFLSYLLGRVRDLAARLEGRSPRHILDRAYQRMDEISERLERSLKNRIASYRERLSTVAAHLNGADPAMTLKRGYVLLSNKEGKLLTRATMVKAGDEVEMKFADGSREARIEK